MFHFPRLIFAGLISLALISAGSSSAIANDPLRLIPDNADLVVKVEKPRQLIESFRQLDVAKEAQELDIVRKVTDTAQIRRFFQLIAYYERDLGHSWPELIDKIAGGGIAMGVKYEKGSDDPILVAVQGTDAALMKKFFEKAQSVVEQELSRQESKVKLLKGKYKEFETWTFGKGLHTAMFEDVILISNQEEALQKGLDLQIANKRDGGKPLLSILNVKGLAEGKKLLSPDPLLWAWINLEYIKQAPEAKNVLTTPRNDSILTFAFAGLLDVARRASFLTLGLYKTPEGFTIGIRMPAGREGRAADVVLHLPEDDSVTSSLPLLEPKGVIFSHSFYLDLGAMWEKRGKIFNESNAKQFEMGVKDGSRFLPGTSIDKILVQSGVHHRFVITQPTKLPYSREPGARFPAFAFVTTMRDPAFAKSVELLVKGGAVIAGTQLTLKSFEEKIGDVQIYGYRFPEDGKFSKDEQNIRFNFVPCVAAVKDQIILCTDLDLLKNLIEILQKEDRAKRTKNMQMRFYAKGAGELLNASPEQLLTQTILSQAIPEAEAKKQVADLLKYLEKLGTLQIETDWQAKEFRFNIVWDIRK